MWPGLDLALPPSQPLSVFLTPSPLGPRGSTFSASEHIRTRARWCPSPYRLDQGHAGSCHQRPALPPGSRLHPTGLTTWQRVRRGLGPQMQGRAAAWARPASRGEGRRQDALPAPAASAQGALSPACSVSPPRPGLGPPQPWGQRAAATQCQILGAQSHIPRCPLPPGPTLRPCRLHFRKSRTLHPTCLLFLSSPGPDHSRAGGPSAALAWVEETGDLHPRCPSPGIKAGSLWKRRRGAELQPVLLTL